MKSILKNNRVTHEKNEYIFFDDNEQIKAKAVLLPSSAKILAENYDFEPISPIQAMNKFNFRSVSLSDIIPLPF